MQQPTDLQIIEQVLNQAVKAGIFANLDSAAAVWRAWGTIKYQIEQANGHTSDTDSNK